MPRLLRRLLQQLWLVKALSDHGDAPITNFVGVCCCMETPILGRNRAVYSTAAVPLQADMGIGGGKMGSEGLFDIRDRKASAETALRAGQHIHFLQTKAAWPILDRHLAHVVK